MLVMFNCNTNNASDKMGNTLLDREKSTTISSLDKLVFKFQTSGK